MMSYEHTIDGFMNKGVKRHELIKKRERKKGRAFLFVQLEPILDRQQQASNNDLITPNDDPFERLRNFK